MRLLGDMADKNLILTKDDVVKAFYSIPDLIDEEGNHFGGMYGALFKLLSSLKTGQYDVVTFSFKEKGSFDDGVYDIPIVKWQIDLFFGKIKSLVSDKEDDEALDEIQFVNSDDVISKIEGFLSELSPSGRGKSAPAVSFKMVVTSDLNEVEALFAKALDLGRQKPDNYISYFFLLDKDVRGLSLCFDKSEVYFIPEENFITSSYLGDKLKNLSKEVSLVTFDIKKSFGIFEPYEISERTSGYEYDSSLTEQEIVCSIDESYKSEPRCFDVLIGAYLLNPIKNDYEPWDVAKEYLGYFMDKKSADGDINAAYDYACKVCNVNLLCAPIIRKKLEKEGMENLFYNMEMPLSYILYSMEREGIIARKEELKAYGDKLLVRISELEKTIYEAAGCEFNINSPKQLGEVLFEKMGLPAEKKTKSGYSTAADVLEKLAPDHKIVADILEYRGLAKLKSTYADGLSAYIEEDGRIHTNFNQTITATGRISSTEPNLQNIPMRTELGRLIRKVFVPKEGYLFADADYSQIELRILAHMSGDQGLIDAYHEGEDIHRITASKVFHVPFEEVTSLQRRNAKAVNFGIVYGISSYGLSQDLDISRAEAKEYMDMYFETYPGVKAYQEKVISDAKAKGYSVTMYGRKRPIPELRQSNFNIRQFGERVAMNAPIQGTAADIIKIAMINVFFRLKKEDLRSRLILQIHDELVIETAEDEKDKVTALLTEEMERAVSLSVPMVAECHAGSDWYEAK